MVSRNLGTNLGTICESCQKSIEYILKVTVVSLDDSIELFNEMDQNVPQTMLRIPFSLRLMVFEPYDSILKSTQT